MMFTCSRNNLIGWLLHVKFNYHSDNELGGLRCHENAMQTAQVLKNSHRKFQHFERTRKKSDIDSDILEN